MKNIITNNVPKYINKENFMEAKSKKPAKMDRKLVAGLQKHEVRDIRVQFYKMNKEEIVHPTSEEIKALVKTHNNSRRKIYASLAENGYVRIKRNS